MSTVERDVTARELRDWMNSLVAHHRDENRLVQDAFAVEIGGEG